MVVTLPTVRPTTSSMESASPATVEPTTTVESASSAVESAAAESSEAASGATHHRSGMETPYCRSRSTIDAVGITASSNIVRSAVPSYGSLY